MIGTKNSRGRQRLYCTQFRMSGGKRKAEEVEHHADRKNSKMFFSTIKAVYWPPKPCTTSLLTTDGTTVLKEKNSINDRRREHFSNLLNRHSTVNTAVLDQVPQKPTVGSLDLPQLWMRSRKPSVRLSPVKPQGWIEFLKKPSSQQDWWHSKPSTGFSPAFGRKTCPKTSGMPQLSHSSKIRVAKLTVATTWPFPSCPLLGRFWFVSSITT